MHGLLLAGIRSLVSGSVRKCSVDLTTTVSILAGRQTQPKLTWADEM